jgi:hypothetical protein
MRVDNPARSRAWSPRWVPPGQRVVEVGLAQKPAPAERLLDAGCTVLAVELDPRPACAAQSSLVPLATPQLVHGEAARMARQGVLHPAIVAFAAAGPWAPACHDVAAGAAQRGRAAQPTRGDGDDRAVEADPDACAPSRRDDA